MTGFSLLIRGNFFLTQASEGLCLAFIFREPLTQRQTRRPGMRRLSMAYTWSQRSLGVRNLRHQSHMNDNSIVRLCNSSYYTLLITPGVNHIWVKLGSYLSSILFYW